ncbi:MAG: 4-(cytidine 5'-diphospho)-2-C-methyl-D-erythritol kinase [Alphaproteobacteria bacterium]|nr:4-(cytidine 5'-diphospho)-2-C-methyl-D-erythritol kinase [Alphaproteobacteria bacterium]
MTGVVIDAPVKLNLYLHVTGRREDGYHLVDTLIAFCAFGDRVTATPADTLTLDATGPFADDLPPGDSNLALRAVKRLKQASQALTGAHIQLEKFIPPAAGVGGGSTDAASAMLAVNKIWGDQALDEAVLYEAARGLGADLPVCLYRRPAFASGIGQDLVAAPILPEAGVLLVNPRVRLSTPSVFGARDGGFQPESADPSVKLSTVADLTAYLQERGNDLTDAAIKLCPAIEDILEALAATPGCRLARMSGSGATCFGLYDTQADAEAAAAHLDAPFWWIQPTRLAIPAPL